jgi:cell division protein FtsI (penicillin-binding protein 3)
MRIAVLGVFQPAPRSQSMADALLPRAARSSIATACRWRARSTPMRCGSIPRRWDGGTPLVKSPREVAAALARIFPDMDQADLTARLVRASPATCAAGSCPKDANRIHALGEPALEFPREIRALLSARVDGGARAGLRGRRRPRPRRHGGSVRRAAVRSASRGNQPAVLSIDTRVQGALEDELGAACAIPMPRARRASILDVDTGEVLALASLPSFNPNLIDDAGTPNIFNRVTNQVYELGSTFKPITVAAALDAGTVTDLGKRYPSGHPLSIGGFQIRDSHAWARRSTCPKR